LKDRHVAFWRNKQTTNMEVQEVQEVQERFKRGSREVKEVKREPETREEGKGQGELRLRRKAGRKTVQETQAALLCHLDVIWCIMLWLA
jgi:hypothetical protein